MFWGCSFLPRLAPSLFSPKIKFLDFMSIPFILLCVTMFGFISLISLSIAKRRGNPPRGNAVAGLILFLSFAVSTPLTVALHRHLPRPLPTGSDMRPFDSATWLSESSTEWNEGISLREQMLKDLVENILPGKDRGEIEELLGPSLETNYFSNLDKDFIYCLGPERDNFFMNIDSEWLLIWLDENGKFVRYKIVND